MVMTEGEEKDSSENGICETFYNPLCISGYLTPLQRKKLREKRKFHSDAFLTSNEPTVNVKKPRGMKRQKEHLANVVTKERGRKRSKERIPQVQCTAAKIVINKGVDTDEKVKKFFKTSSHSRLEKASFTMPLVFKKNAFLDIDKYVKTLSSSLKHKKNAIDSSSSGELGYTPQNVTKNEGDNCELYSEMSSISDEAVYNKSSDSSAERKSLFDFDWPPDEVFLKREANARAVLKDLNYQKESSVSAKQDESTKERQHLNAQPVKLYPIFYVKKQAKNVHSVKSKFKNVMKRKLDSARNGEQMIIDAGQREMGAKVCKTCNMIYTVGQEEDEKLHSNYHDTYLVNLKFPGWKEENVIGEYGDGRIIMIRNDDKSVKLKKIEDILMIANRDLGFSSPALPMKPDLTFVLFISSVRQVAGCLVAEPISSASQVLLASSKSNHEEHLNEQKDTAWKMGNWYSSSETVPALCGINRIWVAHTFRRCKVASRMIDCLRCNFIHGHVIGIRELAFTDPSPSGRAFAAAYTGTDNFLVYK